MPNFIVRTRFNWSAQGLGTIGRAAHRRGMAIQAAENNAPPIRVLHAAFVVDGKDHIEWVVELNVANPTTAVNTVDQFIRGLAAGQGNITNPRLTEVVN